MSLSSLALTIELAGGSSPVRCWTFQSGAPQRISVGSGPEAQWWITGKAIDATHLLLHFTGSVLWAAPCGPARVRLNGAWLVNWSPLVPGSQLELGEARLRVTPGLPRLDDPDGTAVLEIKTLPPAPRAPALGLSASRAPATPSPAPRAHALGSPPPRSPAARSPAPRAPALGLSASRAPALSPPTVSAPAPRSPAPRETSASVFSAVPREVFVPPPPSTHQPRRRRRGAGAAGALVLALAVAAAAWIDEREAQSAARQDRGPQLVAAIAPDAPPPRPGASRPRTSTPPPHIAAAHLFAGRERAALEAYRALARAPGAPQVHAVIARVLQRTLEARCRERTDAPCPPPSSPP